MIEVSILVLSFAVSIYFLLMSASIFLSLFQGRGTFDNKQKRASKTTGNFIPVVVNDSAIESLESRVNSLKSMKFSSGQAAARPQSRKTIPEQKNPPPPDWVPEAPPAPLFCGARNLAQRLKNEKRETRKK